MSRWFGELCLQGVETLDHLEMRILAALSNSRNTLQHNSTQFRWTKASFYCKAKLLLQVGGRKANWRGPFRITLGQAISGGRIGRFKHAFQV